ncbi:MAG: ATP-binding cassette domain-containing protein [Candidatus Delongbacteria bacterium]|nr:ATP-binding cassette domain-containing protein [Candidatus Delongbacteria bacterium]
MTIFQLRDFMYHNILPFQLELAAGQVISLSGPSGSGKTMLLRALCDLDPHLGELRLEEDLCQDTPPHLWRRQVGFLAAETSWWFPTVGEHFSNCDLTRLAELGFSEATLGWDIHRLSAGEKQRLGLLRLLQNQPRILLLDEPTTNLDSVNQQRVEQLLTNWCQREQGAIIWVTHDCVQRRRIADVHFDIVDNQIQEVRL